MKLDVFHNIELFKASAGSGKTYTLMEKIGDMVTKGNVAPESILATTFTIKAANELKERIRSKLLKEREYDKAQQVMDGLIGTVNGICSRLLSEYAIEAGLSPQLDVLPEENAGMIFNSAIASVISGNAEEMEPLAFRMEMNPLRTLKNQQSTDWRELVRKIVNLARGNNLDAEGLRRSAELSIKDSRKLFDGSILFSLDDIHRMITPEYRSLAREIDRSKDADTYGKGTIAFSSALLKFDREQTWHNAAALCKGPVKPCKDIFGTISDTVNGKLLRSKELAADVQSMIWKLFQIAGECLDAYREFKEHYALIDFVDQETGLLKLMEQEKFRVSIGERVSQIMVDEFQDTSPIQLALFLKLHEAVGKSIWVGDPKQAIYGFRGTDPELMRTVAGLIPNGKTLKYSWRSRNNLVELANAVFKESFKGTMPEAEVCLGIAESEQGKEKRQGGVIESWMIAGKVDNITAKIAEGIAALKKENSALKYGDIAVLLRSNAKCADLAAELSRWNIPAAAPSGLLNEMPECQLVMAAYRYAVDKYDTSALAILAAFLLEPEGWLASLASDKDQTWERWKNDPRIVKLGTASEETPLELLDKVISVLSLDRRIDRMTDSGRRERNVEELRKLAATFMNQAKLNRTPATHSGFIAFFLNGEQPAASGVGGDCVQVMTYHKSKGLEWPIVILGSLDSGLEKTPFDLRAVQTEAFDPAHPLANRLLSCIPNPLGGTSLFKETDKDLKKEHEYLPEYEELLEPVRVQDREEAKRLMYVGLTRARDQIVFAAGYSSPKTGDKANVKWLELLTDNSLFAGNWKFNDDNSTWNIGHDQFQVRTRHFNDLPSTPEPSKEAPAWQDVLPVPASSFAPARLSPSSVEADEKTLAETIVIPLDFPGTPLKTGRTSDYATLGTTIHNYIALTLEDRNDSVLAAEMISRMGMDGILTPELLMSTRDSLRRFLDANWPNAKLECEVPMTLRNEQGTLYQGFIDLLLETPEGFVIIDHKSHPNAKDAEAYVKKCAPQIKLYADAVAKATGKPVMKTMIHLPILGKCFEVK